VPIIIGTLFFWKGDIPTRQVEKSARGAIFAQPCRGQNQASRSRPNYPEYRLQPAGSPASGFPSFDPDPVPCGIVPGPELRPYRTGMKGVRTTLSPTLALDIGSGMRALAKVAPLEPFCGQVLFPAPSTQVCQHTRVQAMQLDPGFGRSITCRLNIPTEFVKRTWVSWMSAEGSSVELSYISEKCRRAKIRQYQ
jgi:hypothetical protein